MPGDELLSLILNFSMLHEGCTEGSRVTFLLLWVSQMLIPHNGQEPKSQNRWEAECMFTDIAVNPCVFFVEQMWP